MTASPKPGSSFLDGSKEKSMAKNKTFEITLQLAEIEHLFQKPDISPLSEDYQVYSCVAGIEFISNELYANPSHDAVKARLLLPPDQITPGLDGRATAAVARYCQGETARCRSGNPRLTLARNPCPGHGIGGAFRSDQRFALGLSRG